MNAVGSNRGSDLSGFLFSREPEWSWGSVLSASGGTLAGVLLGGSASVLIARARGGQSLADYGPALFVCLTTAYVLGLVGCYLALRVMDDPCALQTVAILAVMLPGSVWAVGPVVRMLARMFHWTFGIAIPVTIVLLPLSVVLPPIAARLIAGLFPRER